MILNLIRALIGRPTWRPPKLRDDDLISRPRTDREQWYRSGRLLDNHIDDCMTTAELRQAVRFYGGHLAGRTIEDILAGRREL